ncbi:MAG TPA: peptidylprolyl isomerase [Acidimicrobiales bacterium]
MKWLLALLVLLGGGVAWAAFAVPTNAATVNGTTISQDALNSDITAIAGSADYQCYLNSEEYLSSNGSQQGLPPVTGAGQGQSPGDTPTANSTFVATYLDTVIGHQIVLQLADRRNVTVTSDDLTSARASLTGQISSVMSEVAQTAQGGNKSFTCGATTAPLTGDDVLNSLPASFVDQQVQFVATASALQEDLSGVGSSESDLQAYYERHRSEFDTVCFNAAEFTSQSAAATAQAAVNSGTAFSAAVSAAAQSGTFPCSPLVAIAGDLGTDLATLQGLALNKASAPISVNGNYVVLQPTKRSPTPYASVKADVSQEVQELGSQKAQAAITAAERRSSVTVDPRYGEWQPATAQILTPFVPKPSDVLNPPANESATSSSKSPFSG